MALKVEFITDKIVETFTKYRMEINLMKIRFIKKINIESKIHLEGKNLKSGALTKYLKYLFLRVTVVNSRRNIRKKKFLNVGL